MIMQKTKIEWKLIYMTWSALNQKSFALALVYLTNFLFIVGKRIIRKDHKKNLDIFLYNF